MKKLLFQGDSITDAGRVRENDENHGNGYATLLKSHISFEYPDQYVMYNRGISGNQVSDLYARIREDFVDLQPDIISILIGVNDAWYEITKDEKGNDKEEYFRVYSKLIEEVKAALPNVKIMLMEPFVLESEARQENWGELRQAVETRSQMVRQIAERHDLIFIPLQQKFDEAAKLAYNDYWLRDGVHPTAAGHELIKREWLKAYSSLF